MDRSDIYTEGLSEAHTAYAGGALDEETVTMGYRGEDLDLRTPQTWSAAPQDLSNSGQNDQLNGPRSRAGTYAASRGGPIWVDDTVLACCNYAYDIAVVHKAGEVRLEHLLHALTRVDPAAAALASRGVQVATLRRDSAVVVTSEIPAGLFGNKIAPRRSDEFEDILRLAAALSYRRNAPANIDDLVQVLFEAAPDVPSLSLLRQSFSRPPTGYGDPMPNFVRPQYTPDIQDPRAPRGYYQNEPRPVRSEFTATPTDNIQNVRLDTLEQMVRALSNDLGNERRVFTTALQDLQREVLAHRDDTSRLSGGLPDGNLAAMGDRMASLETAVLNVRPGTGTDVGPIHERLSTIERALAAALNDTSRAAETVVAKVGLLETELRRRSDASVDLTPVINRLDIIEEAVLSHDSDGVRNLSDRMKKLEDALQAGRTRAADAEAAFASEIKALTAAVERQRGEMSVAVLTPLAQKFDEIGAAFESRQADSSRGLNELLQRVTAFERSVSDYTVKSAEAGAAYAKELGEVHDALMKLNANQHTLAGAVDMWRQQGASAFASLGSRMDGLGTSVGFFGQRLEGVEKEEAKTVPMLETLAGTVDRMHKVTVERYHRRNRFWYWLFGTDDWVAASWPSQAARMSEELKAVKAPVKK